MALPFLQSGGGGGGGVVAWSAISNASANLTLVNAGFSTTFNQTSAVTWAWANVTAATSTVAQSSPILSISGQYWTGSASAADGWTVQNVLANGTNGASTLTITHSGSTGNAQVQFPAGSSTFPSIAVSANQGLGRNTASILQIIAGGTGSFVQFGTTASQGGLQILCSPSNPQIATVTGGSFLTLGGLTNGQTNQSSVVLNNGSISFTGTVTPNGIVNVQGTYAATTGTFPFFGLSVTPTINQSGTGNGTIRVLSAYPVNTALVGTEYLLALGTSTAMGVGGTLTDKFLIDSNGAMYLAAAAAAPASAGTAGTIGQTIMNGGNLYFCSVTGAAGSATWNKLTMTAV